jgi:hypothetical protein
MNLELREQARAKSIKSAHGNKDSGSIATRLPHAPSDDAVADENVERETVDLIEDVLVSPEGIEPARNEPKASCGAPDDLRAKPLRAT